MIYCEILISGPVRNIQQEVLNGDMGRISAIDEEAQVIKVMIDDREIAYDYTDLDEWIQA
jgi:exodeoxyribonuclease V alpha subunit